MLRPANLIAFQARIEPNKPAIVSGDSVVTYGMLEQGTRAAAHRIAGFGLPRGSIVALSIEAPGRHLAVSLALERCGLVGAAFASQTMYAALPPAALVLTDKPFLMPDGKQSVVVDDSWFGVMPPGGAALPEPGPEDDYRIFLSSGTTGVPKPIIYTQACAAERVVEITTALEMIGAFNRVLQLFGVVAAGGYMGTLAALAHGKTVYFPTAGQDPLQLVQIYQCQFIQCATQQLSGMVDRQKQRYLPLHSLVGIATGGSIVPIELIRDAQSLVCGRIFLAYGSSELLNTAMELVNVHDFEEGATGFICPWAEAEVVDSDRKLLPPGEVGELRFRVQHQANFGGEPAPDGRGPWFYPGDVGAITPARRLVVSGRVTDLININGTKMSPERIERFLLSCPGVTDAAVAGFRRADGSEEIRGMIVGSADLEAVKAHVHAILPAAVPKTLLRVDSIERTPQGKIRRDSVKSLLETA